MEYPTRDILEYIVALVAEFAKAHGLSDTQAFRYLSVHGAVDFVEQNYGVMHTLDFPAAVESVAKYCRRTGGKL